MSLIATAAPEPSDVAVAETPNATVTIKITGYSGFTSPPELVVASDGSEPQRERPPRPALRLVNES